MLVVVLYVRTSCYAMYTCHSFTICRVKVRNIYCSHIAHGWHASGCCRSCATASDFPKPSLRDPWLSGALVVSLDLLVALYLAPPRPLQPT
jgi:hypothetical protein